MPIRGIAGRSMAEHVLLSQLESVRNDLEKATDLEQRIRLQELAAELALGYSRVHPGTHQKGNSKKKNKSVTPASDLWTEKKGE